MFTKSEHESKYFYLQNKNRPDIKKKREKNNKMKGEAARNLTTVLFDNRCHRLKENTRNKKEKKQSNLSIFIK